MEKPMKEFNASQGLAFLGTPNRTAVAQTTRAAEKLTKILNLLSSDTALPTQQALKDEVADTLEDLRQNLNAWQTVD